MGFYFMPFTSALVFQRLFFLCNFLEGKDLCFIIVSLLLPVLPQLSCYFHHFKVILLLLVHFSFGFPFCSVVIMFGYLFCCLLVRFFPLDFGPSFYLCVHMPPKSKSFFFQPHLSLCVGSTCTLLCSFNELDVSFEFSPPKWG